MFFDPFNFLPLLFSTGFLVLGIMVIKNPSLMWVTEKWKYRGEAQPSEHWLRHMRIMGVLWAIIGIIGMVVSVKLMLNL